MSWWEWRDRWVPYSLNTQPSRKYLEFVIVEKDNGKGYYEYVDRINNQEAVVIIPLIKEEDHERVVIIEHRRYPFGKRHVLEFPAGLIDKGESIEEAALRELKEETNQNGKVLSVSPPVASSSGVTSEVIHLAEVEIDYDKDKVFKCLDENEEIDGYHILSTHNLPEKLKELSESGKIISSRLMAYAMGMNKK